MYTSRMTTWITVLVAYALSLATSAFAGTQGSTLFPKPGSPSKLYTLKQDISGPGFYAFFKFEAIEDPTHGRVQYVDEPTAIRENLTFATPDTFILRADHKTVLTPTSPGRKSVRIISRDEFKTHIAIFDVRHMPEGCATWPAIWELYPTNWPSGGEIDIIEGVNNQAANQATIHTTSGCSMPPSSNPASNRTQLGSDTQNKCDWEVNYNAGCGVSFPKSGPPTFGPAFNKAGGGWFVLERTPTVMKIWFWSRNDPTVPAEVKSKYSAVVNPSTYGIPYAYFPNTQCEFNKYFKENNLVINLTLCGDWAGGDDVWKQTGCPAPSCNAFVETNPAAFADAFFDFANIRIYEQPFDLGIYPKRHVEGRRKALSHNLGVKEIH
ncbi:concanavalin A-like lectin/glucanase domain-containing protein [Crepidotus variabilis]|uniref:Concanavalin A-like lectin/glucanase domain-containing protein n=1 Tax=Crepidotus variabilis TaxID=179855 RepID=A0A9P6JL59_9AGAR|nr:concanavalin A-like lectin/glucanase domain-containing protein [Crepidotus variabilis]